mmetsp:Transcript_68986/g.224891  ORF Transcript_68986/g.224891 Transcript_68986/m.224891 type:complete len:400 (-) Transcript_68986:155-1354(-)
MLAAAGLSLLGFTMPAPIMPALRVQFGLSAGQVGLISSSFAAGMFFAVMILPAVSDTRGRKPVAVLALAMTGVGFLAQALVLSLGLGFQAFLLARFLTGLFAGCNPIFKAYLADVVPASMLSTYLVYREAAATTAFVVGPALGGYLATTSMGVAAPLFATALAQLVAACAVWALMEESIGLRRGFGGEDGERRGGGAVDRSTSEDKRVSWPLVLIIFAISFVYVVGQCCFSSFFPLLMNDRFGASPRDIGAVSTCYALVALSFQVLCYKPVSRRLGLLGVGALGALAIAAGLAGLVCDAVPLWVAALVYAVGVASFPATIPTLLARSVPSSRRGLALGVDSIVNSLCRVVAPLSLGVLYARSPGLCFQTAGVLMLSVVAALLCLGRSRVATAALTVTSS